MEPLVSIVIPVYNGADYLEEAICSVLEQTYASIELIVLDDGSTDRTPYILQKYSHVLVAGRHDNMGQSKTLNKGWELSRGDILSYLSADDKLLPRAVEEAVRELSRSDEVVLTYCDYNLIDAESRHIRKVQAPDFSYEDMAIRLVCQPGPGVFFRRSAYIQAGGWSGQFRQMPDFDYWLRLGLLGPFRRIPQVHALYRVHEQSQTFAMVAEARAGEPVAIMTAYFDKQQGVPAHIRRRRRQALSNACLLSARLHIKSNRLGQGLRISADALRLYPRNLLSFRTFRLLTNALINRPIHQMLHRLRKSGRS